MVAQLLLFLFFSNNIAIKFGDQKLIIIGMAVLYSAIVGLKKNSKSSLKVTKSTKDSKTIPDRIDSRTATSSSKAAKNSVILEYVYKKENQQT